MTLFVLWHDIFCTAMEKSLGGLKRVSSLSRSIHGAIVDKKGYVKCGRKHKGIWGLHPPLVLVCNEDATAGRL